MDVVQKTFKEDGAKGFFKGYLPSTVRAVFVNATIFMFVVAAKRALGDEAVASGH